MRSLTGGAYLCCQRNRRWALASVTLVAGSHTYTTFYLATEVTLELNPDYSRGKNSTSLIPHLVVASSRREVKFRRRSQ